MKDFKYHKKANEMDLEESETDERDQVEKPQNNMSNIQELMEDGNLEYTDTEMEHG